MATQNWGDVADDSSVSELVSSTNQLTVNAEEPVEDKEAEKNEDVKIEEEKEQLAEVPHPQYEVGENGKEVGWEVINMGPLQDKIRSAIDAKGWAKPSAIQIQSIPFIQQGYNIKGQAPFGSGKSGAFVLGALSRINPKAVGTQVIILSSTIPLASQTAKVAEELSKDMRLSGDGGDRPVSVYLMVGGVKDAGPVQHTIVCATIGSLMARLQSRKKMPLDDVMMFVVDEADEMIKSNLRINTERSWNIISKGTKQKVSCLLFSATFDESVDVTANKLLGKGNVQQIVVPAKLADNQRCAMVMIHCDKDGKKMSKQEQLKIVLKDMDRKVLVFFNNIKELKEIHNYLVKEKIECSSYFSGLDQATKENTLKDYLGHKTNILLTTNILARGIDCKEIRVVINYGVPILFKSVPQQVDLDIFTNRCARTARWTETGTALTLIDQKDKDAGHVAFIKEKLNREFTDLPPQDDMDVLVEIMDKVEGKIKEKVAKAEKEAK